MAVGRSGTPEPRGCCDTFRTPCYLLRMPRIDKLTPQRLFGHCLSQSARNGRNLKCPTMISRRRWKRIAGMAGGVVHDQLKRVCKYHFIGANPPETRMIAARGTVRADRIVDAADLAPYSYHDAARRLANQRREAGVRS
jgi:hypothetical protein